MSDGIKLQETQEFPQESKEVTEARAELDQATYEAPAKIEEGDIQTAEKTQSEFTAVVDAVVNSAPADRRPGTEGAAEAAADGGPTTGDEEAVSAGAELDQPPSGSIGSAGQPEIEADIIESVAEGLAQSAQDAAEGVRDQVQAALELLRESAERRSAIAQKLTNPSAPPEGGPGEDQDQLNADTAAYTMEAAADQVAPASETHNGAEIALEAANQKLDAAEEALLEAEAAHREAQQDGKKPDATKPTSSSSAGIDALTGNASMGEVLHRAGESESGTEGAGPESRDASGKAGFGAPAENASEHYSAVQLAQGEVLQDSDWNQGSLDGEEPEEAIPAGEDFQAGGANDLKKMLSPLKNNLGALREMVVDMARKTGGSLTIEAALVPEPSEAIETDQLANQDIQNMLQTQQDQGESTADASSDNAERQNKREAINELREESLMLKDEISDWPDDGSTREITYSEVVINEDGSYSVVEKTEVLTKDQAEHIVANIENQITAISQDLSDSEPTGAATLQEELASASRDWRSAAVANSIADPGVGEVIGPIDDQTADQEQAHVSPGSEGAIESNELMDLLGNLEATRHRLEMDISSLQDFIAHAPQGQIENLLVHIPTPDGQGGYRLVPQHVPADVNGAVNLLLQQQGFLAQVMAEISQVQSQLGSGGSGGGTPGASAGSSSQASAAANSQGSDWQGAAADNGVSDPRLNSDLDQAG